MANDPERENKSKKRGETEEREADAISFELYRLLCKLAIKANNMFLWAFTVMQWNCMARSVNIDDMTFAQISLGTDSLVVEYCDSKADQKGELAWKMNMSGRQCIYAFME